ncbi:hypothetical protein PABG_07413 [Paracoccidioides brasiliensis Pb03]|nr:hypothetical protein PABG_07413 [Paracoccidioides brasiliensis Pb03]
MDTRPPTASGLPDRKSARCRFFGSRKGCRAGNDCPYAHVVPSAGPVAASSERSTSSVQVNDPRPSTQQSNETMPFVGRNENESTTSSAQTFNSRPQRSTDILSQPVQRPIPRAQLENPREFQINQIRRRFHPEERSNEEGTHLMFEMYPSDPDFTSSLNSLTCAMHVPLGYPSQGTPSLDIFNKDIDAKYKMLIQQEFENITKTRISDTLLTWMNILDRSLTKVFSTPHPRAGPAPPGPSYKGRGLSFSLNDQETTMIQEKEKARQRRKREITQLTSRLGRVPLFSESADGVSFTIPVNPLKPQLLPPSLKSVKKIDLTVPLLYPLEPCYIKFPGIDDNSARATEASFEKHVIGNPGASLTSHINYLSTMLHTLATQPVEDAVTSLSLNDKYETEVGTPSSSTLPPDQSHLTETRTTIDVPDRPHIQVIPRPPEWILPKQGDEFDSDSDESDYSEPEESATDEDDDDDDESGGVSVPPMPPPPTGRDVALSFPSMELLGIELLELKTLHLTLKCERCKEFVDIKNIKIGEDGLSVLPKRVGSCKKCGNNLSIGFRRELMHPSSNRAGYLDLEGCLVVELLPSNFMPTCSECSTTYPAPGIVAVRGDDASAICRECHHKMRFKIPEVKFLLVSAGAGTSRTHARMRKPKEKLGIVAGQELPRRGRCSHYGKSYRWFRFSCCLKVFPCDRCHDAASDHPNEHANRMICGFCSREQTYRPESCGICHSTLIGKAGSGFWEGGKGTRDKTKMSRKDRMSWLLGR